MIIDTVTRLEALERGMRDVVMPAIDPLMVNAVEQVQYMLLQLQALIKQVDIEYPLQLDELRHLLVLSNDLGKAVGDELPATLAAEIEAVRAASATAAAIQLTALSEVREQVMRARVLVDDLTVAAMAGASATRQAATRAVLAHSAGRDAALNAWTDGTLA